MDYRTEAQEEKKSKYNAALSQLYRIDNLWQTCHYHRRHGNLFSWNHNLDCIWTELAGDVNDEAEYKTLIAFKRLIIENKINRNILNQILMEKEIWLRKLQNKQGKGTAYVDPYEDLLED